MPSAPGGPLSQVPSPEPPREPPRELLLPVAQEALAIVCGALPKGFRQALLTIALDVRGAKARFFVHLVALDPEAELVALDPSQALFDAVATLIGDERRYAGGAWHKLVLRLRTTERGASIEARVS
jgi:hypothetical protein